MLPADLLQEQVRGGTWRDMFDSDGLAASFPLPVWVLELLAAGLIGFPYAWIVARSLPDRGYALSRVVGLLLVTWVVWWISSMRVLPFTRSAIAVAVAIVGAGAVAIVVHQRVELVTWIRARWRLLLVEEAVFWTLFGLALFVRWSNPDLWHDVRGGEKPMDFAYLNAVAKSESFPPFDPWFAGGQMNYYYYGFVQIAALAKLVGLPPAVAYNLAIPTLVALLGSAVFCAGLGFASSTSVRRRTAVAVATLATLLAAVLGNLGELRVLRSALDRSIPVEWWFWNPTRVIAPGPGEPGPITEFPAFTYIYGDLHAHAMALPLAALAVALVVAVVREPAGKGWPWTRLGLLGLVLGALWVTNTWDFPTYLLLACCGLTLAALPRLRSWRGLASLATAGLFVAGVAYAAFLPFHLRYDAVFQGVEHWRGSRTGLSDYLIIHGVFLFTIVSGLLVRLAYERDLGSVARSFRLGLRTWDRVRRRRQLCAAIVRQTTLQRIGAAAVPLALLVAAALALLGHWPAASAVVVGLLAVLAWPVARGGGARPLDHAVLRLVLVLVLIGLALTVAVEYAVVQNIDIGRVNTVFKLYLQVWILWALAAAACAGLVWRRLPRMRPAVGETWRVAFGVLLAVATLYPLLAARAKIDDRLDSTAGRTLDGAAFMRTAVHSENGAEMQLGYDHEAIAWMQQNVDGSPVVMEANTTPTLYGWQGRYSIHTGNPSIVGWDYHQRQQRPAQSEEVQERVADVQSAYRTADPALAHEILSRYGASYVVVGPLERAYFPEGGAKWEQGLGTYWDVAYENPGVTIYRVASVG